MLGINKTRYFACDFETTVWDNVHEQTECEVWAAASVELFSDEKPLIQGNITSFLERFFKEKGNFTLYFHNLKFDGSYILDYLLRCGYKFTTSKISQMKNREFSCIISEMGQFYNIRVKRYGKIVEFRDSLKLLPFSLQRIGDSFKTLHRKLEMDYKGHYQANIPISKEERAYIENDVYVLKEALEMMFKQGHDKLTIGSCCLAEFKTFFFEDEYKAYFPDLTANSIDIQTSNKLSTITLDEYFRKSYRGGFCYVNEEYQNKIIPYGVTLDVNSLYPSVMHSLSGNYYPVGYPKFWQGNHIPEKALENNRVFFIRFKCRFTLKENKIPTVQIKGNALYKGNEYLKTSDINYKGKYYKTYIDTNGKKQEAKPVMTMTCIDYNRFLSHYNVEDLEILDGAYFNTEIGLFDKYINKWAEIKANSKDAERELAKLFLNNLYGKLASSTDSTYRIPFLDPEKDVVRFHTVVENEKEAGYIPIGSFVTSYARDFTITAAQKNHETHHNFAYADTDSLHLTSREFTGLKVHKSDLLCWDNEGNWINGKFVRQKTYIEFKVDENDNQLYYEKKDREGNITLEPDINIKCASMKEATKDYFKLGLLDGTYTLDDFGIGLCIHNTQLKSKRIKGGVLLYPHSFEMR